MLSNLFLMRKSYCYRTDLLQMLNNFISHEEELLLQNRFVTNAEQFIIYMFLSRSALVVIFLKAKMSFCSFCRRVSCLNFSNDISIGTEA